MGFRELAAKGQTELYFATRWTLEPILMTGTGTQHTWHDDSNLFVPELTDSTAALRRFRSTTEPTGTAEYNCMESSTQGLLLQPFASSEDSGFEAQLLDGNEVGTNSTQ